MGAHSFVGFVMSRLICLLFLNGSRIYIFSNSLMYSRYKINKLVLDFLTT